MRPIDADVLKQHIDKLPALPDGNFAGNHSALKALVNMQPTIEPSTNCSEFPNNSDLISRQATIDALMAAIDDVGILDGADIKVVFDNLPSVQPEPHWIPVSERLPEIGGEYLVSVRWYREDDIDIDVYDYDARCKEWNDGESCGQRVIAWMPLPVVYKPNKK